MRPLIALLLVLSSCHAVRTNRTKAPPAKADFLRALRGLIVRSSQTRMGCIAWWRVGGMRRSCKTRGGRCRCRGRLALGVVLLLMGEAEGGSDCGLSVMSRRDERLICCITCMLQRHAARTQTLTALYQELVAWERSR